MGRIKQKKGQLSITTIALFTLIAISLMSAILISSCENPVQSYIKTNLYGPKYNLEVKKFTVSNAFNYGRSVATYGDYIIIGAPADRSNTTEAEVVYIYHRTDIDKWEGPFKLPIPAEYVTGDRFGYSVSIYGDFAVIGAPDTSVEDKPNAGAVYIYRRKEGSTNEWEVLRRLTKADQNPLFYSVTGNEGFGKSVKLYNKWLLIGAPYDGLNGPESNYGAVYRFKYNGNTWEYDYFFSPNTLLSGAQFGMAIDVNSSYAVIGAPGEDIDGKSNVGSVYIYSFNNDKFESKERITNLDGYTGNDDYFGGSLSISGDFLAIGVGGAIVDDTFIAGKIQMYLLKDGTWNNTPTTIQLEKPQEYDFFGYPVALKQIGENNYILLAGCFDRDNENIADAGAAYIYTNTDGSNNWTLQKELRASDVSESSYFGQSIALGDDYAVIGACTPRDDTLYTGGGVYIFR